MSASRPLPCQEQVAELRKQTQYTLPRSRRLLQKPVHRRVLSVRGAYRLAQKRSLGLGGGELSASSCWTRHLSTGWGVVLTGELSLTSISAAVVLSGAYWSSGAELQMRLLMGQIV
jgi:hypothetical protein